MIDLQPLASSALVAWGAGAIACFILACMFIRRPVFLSDDTLWDRVQFVGAWLLVWQIVSIVILMCGSVFWVGSGGGHV